VSKIMHMCLSVRGALNWPLREQKQALKWCKREGGAPFRDVQELRSALMDELAQGHEVIPMTACDNFDFKTGCRGHAA
jgi:hypothetical protein